MDTIITQLQQLDLLLLGRQITCCECDSNDLRPIQYGLGAEGGCIIGSESPKLFCNVCRSYFYD